MTLEKTYSPDEIESKWYQHWEKNGLFKANADKPSYCIVIPPPNVTGTLHMGHAFQDTIMDLLIRYHKMNGDNTLWQAGTDHAGIATQMVVERQLNQEGLNRHEIGREEFIKRIWQWKEHSGGNISTQLKRLGASLDWSRERFTMDDVLSKTVQHVFIKLYEEGLIYRGKRLVNWDPVLLTAISDLEVVSEEEKGSLWHIKYPLADGKEHIVIATTRPETMLGDVAVAVHPEDERYKHLIGKKIQLPLANRTIPIIADDYVEPEFGTGCVKITPAHDFNDYEVGKRHNLEMINIFTPTAHINDQAPPQFQGLDRFKARTKVIEELEAQGLLAKVEDHTLKVPRGDRTNSVIEPYLTDQWFVKTAPLAKPAIDAVKNGNIKFIPENWSKTYFEWMNNIEDWCISRQLWWGHRIPAWFDEAGNIYVGTDEAVVRQQHKLAANIKLTQDEDVLDTWFSSALWPFSTLGWPEQTPEYNAFYPTNVLVTGFDIIFFWVARMIMMGLKFTDKVPFNEVYVHGLIQDQDGKKMSKSKGNVIDPLDLIDGITLDKLVEKRTQGLMQPQQKAKIEKTTKKQFPLGIDSFGTDALRFTFCNLASTGRHIRFDLQRVEGNRNFCNKLWNAARFVLMHVDSKIDDSNLEFSAADKWINTKLQQTIFVVNNDIKNYRFDLASSALYEFVWNQFCDWYVEFSKATLNDTAFSTTQKNAAKYTLINVLEHILRLLHPLMPFITEEIWQKISDFTAIDTSNITSILQAPYPQFKEKQVDDNAATAIDWVKQFVLGVRSIRGEMNISPAMALEVLCQQGSDNDYMLLQQNRSIINALAKIKSIDTIDGKAPLAATALVGEMKILVPLKGFIDKESETLRLNKEIEKLNKEKLRAENKLNNPNYTAKAPAAVVAKEKQTLEAANAAISKLQQQLQDIQSL